MADVSGKDEQRRSKDFWEILEVFSKLSVPIAVVIVSFVASWTLQAQEERTAARNLFIQMALKREEVGSNIRLNMFKEILASIVNNQRDDLEKDVLNVELLAANFHDVIDIRPVLMILHTEIAQNIEHPPPRSDSIRSMDLDALPGMRDRILLLAKKIRDEERSALKSDDPRNYNSFKFFFNDSENPGRQEYLNQFRVGGFDVLIGIDGIVDSDFPTMNFWFSVERDGEPVTQESGVIDPFVFPLVNNYRIGDGDRAALVFVRSNDTDEGKVFTFDFVIFPETRAGLKDRPYYEDLLSRLEERMKDGPNYEILPNPFGN